MAMPEKGDMPVRRADSRNHTIGPHADLLWVFAAWVTISEKHPPGRFRVDYHYEFGRLGESWVLW